MPDSSNRCLPVEDNVKFVANVSKYNEDRIEEQSNNIPEKRVLGEVKCLRLPLMKMTANSMLAFSLTVMKEIIHQVYNVQLVVEWYADIHTATEEVLTDAMRPHCVRCSRQDPRFPMLGRNTRGSFRS